MAALVVMHLMVSPPSAGDRHTIAVVEGLHTTLLTVMKEGAKIGYNGRYDRLEPIIKTRFDLPFIAKTVVGRYWETFSLEQKTRFVETFSRLSIATYAANFDSYSGERFKTVSEKEVSGGILVKSLLIKSDGGEVRLDYLLHQIDNQWRIINVIANGVSDLALKRADYSALLKSKGFETLLVRLNEKIAQFSAESARPEKR
jgi:phospholipid transport system substrate-binding protein